MEALRFTRLFLHLYTELIKTVNHGKGTRKNTKNKALHTKLLNRKKTKLQEEKKEKALLKVLVTKNE
jgi:hypothetical protein